MNFAVAACLVAAMAGTAWLAPAIAAPGRVPALVDPRVQEHHVGKVIFEELATPDLAAAERFYAALFGWRFQDLDSGGTRYATATLDGRLVGGLVQRDRPAGHGQPAWLTFVAVRDVDAARATAVRNGATVLLEPRDVPDRGREAVFADPQGAVFAVLGIVERRPRRRARRAGRMDWSSLFTRDPDTDAGFYQALLDYEVFDLPSSGSDKHLMLASQDYARASANTLPATTAGAHPHWIDYVRVDDAATMVAKAVSLGARVLVGPPGSIAMAAMSRSSPIRRARCLECSSGRATTTRRWRNDRPPTGLVGDCDRRWMPAAPACRLCRDRRRRLRLRAQRRRGRRPSLLRPVRWRLRRRGTDYGVGPWRGDGPRPRRGEAGGGHGFRSAPTSHGTPSIPSGARGRWPRRPRRPLVITTFRGRPMAISSESSVWMWAEACERLGQAERLQRQFFRPTASQAVTAAWEPPADVYEDWRGRSFGILGAMSSIGVIIGAPFGGYVGKTFGWRTAMIGFACVACVAAICFQLLYRRTVDEPGTPVNAEAKAADKRAQKSPFRHAACLGTGLRGGRTRPAFVRRHLFRSLGSKDAFPSEWRHYRTDAQRGIPLLGHREPDRRLSDGSLR